MPAAFFLRHRRALRPLGGVAALLLPLHAAASCIGSGDRAIDALERAAAVSPGPALDKIRTARQREAGPERRAWLRSLENLAAGMAGLADARLAEDARALQPTLPPGSPALLRLQLTAIASEPDTLGRAAQVRALLPRLGQAALPAAARVCLLSEAARILNQMGHAAEGFEPAAQAFKAAAGEAGGLPHAVSASILAQSVRFQGDYGYSAELSEIALRYFRQERLSDRLSDELSMRAWAFIGLEDLDKARVDMVESLAAARAVRNPVAVARAQSNLCYVLTRTRQFSEAQPLCDAAYAHFQAEGDLGDLWTPVFHADYLFESGHAPQALALLDRHLGDAAGQSLRFQRAAFHLRARLRRALGQPEGAYADLARAYAQFERIDTDERRLSSEVSRARFRSEQLARDLSQVTADRARILKLNTWIGGLALLCVALLVTIVAVALKHRRTYREWAYADALTGVANRRFATARLEQMIAHAQSRGEALCVALLDLDHFKACNDQWGHAAGDAALKALAEMARRVLRPGDLFGRWGGEEFVLALPATTADESLKVVERLRQAAAGVALQEAPGYGLRFSAGLVAVPAAPASLERIIHAVDQALYAAKTAGRNRSVLAA